MFDENNNIIPEQNIEQENTQQPSVTEDNVQNAYLPYRVLPPHFHQKRELRRKALGIGIPCLCLTALGFVWSSIYLFFTVKVGGLTTQEAINLSQDPAAQQILQIIISVLMFLVPFSIAAKCMGLRIDKTVQFGKAKKGTFLPFLLLGVGFCAFFNIATSYASNLFEGFGVEYDVNFGDNPSGFFGFLLTFIATAIVPALVEEFACRGIIMGMLKKYGDGFAIITSSIVFGIMHGNFEQIPFAVMVGLVLGYIYVKTNSIWTCVAIHCANNAVSVAFTYLSGNLSTNLQNLLYIIYLVAALLVAIIGLYLLSQKSGEQFALEPADDNITLKQKYTWFFTSWSIVLFIVLNIAESFKYFKL